MLFDQGLYYTKQHFFDHNKHLNNYELIKSLQINNNPFYRKYPNRIAKHTLFSLNETFTSFFELNTLYKNGGLANKPRIPKYLKSKNKDLYQTTFTKEAINKPSNNKIKKLSIDPLYKDLIKDYYNNIDKLKLIHLSGTSIYLLIELELFNNIKELRVIPKSNYFKIEFIYKVNDVNIKKDNNRYCGMDLGVNNLITAVFNTGDNPIIIDGKEIKTINQYFNKQVKRLKKIAKKCNGQDTTKAIQRLTKKRNDKIDTLFHEISTNIVNYLVSLDISIIIIGKNKEWKQKTKGKLMKKVNQMFQQIPYNKLIHQIEYKCKLQGIKTIVNEESYTSKCSFIDNEEIKKHKIYKGKRVKRGLFKTSTGRYINADVNGAYNILRKVIPIFGWSEALSVKPIKYKINSKIKLIDYIKSIKQNSIN